MFGFNILYYFCIYFKKFTLFELDFFLLSLFCTEYRLFDLSRQLRILYNKVISGASRRKQKKESFYGFPF